VSQRACFDPDYGVAEKVNRVRELLDYDAGTGEFTWKVDRAHNATAGSKAGCINEHGYVQVFVDRKKWRGHTLAWFYVHGEIPRPMLDHINGIRHDNRLSNLRIATREINTQNLKRARRDSTSGLLGVVKERGNRWKAEIQANGKRIYLGCFSTPQEAHAAYLGAKRSLHQGGTL
jgi:hypothetical protein